MAPSSPPRTLESRPRAAAGIDKRIEAVCYLAAGLLCCAALIWALQLWRADLHVPFYYSANGDLTFENMVVKDIVENGWYLHNPQLGAPGVQDLRDFPIPDTLHLIPMKIIGWFTSSWGAVVNVYFLASFLLATWSALAVQRHFGIGRGPAVVTSLLFAFAPYHFYRGENHLHLSGYYVIPLAALVLLWIMYDESLFVPVRRGRFFVLPVPKRKGIAAIAVCVILGSSGVYYAYLTILLLVVAGLYRAVERNSLRRAASAAMLAGVIAAAVVLNLLPNIAHILVDGKNPEVAVRAPAEAEAFAMKLTQLVLPVTGHRIQGLAHFKAEYNHTPWPSPISEGDGSALGACLAAGFCFLLVTLVAGCPGTRHRELMRRLGPLNLGAFLIGTVGGVGAILAWTISPQIRSYARAGIFIAFFAAMAIAAILDEVRRRWGRTGLYSWIFRGALAVLLAAGMLDQITAADVPPYPYASEQYRNDADFAARAEEWLPHGAMVLQLPFVRFPESPSPYDMAPYEHLRPYLHSVSLRWSYGAMKGRYWDEWQGDLTTRPIDEMVEAAAVAGFSAIYIDRNGYADRGASIQTLLNGMGLTRIENRDGRWWLYDIGPYAARLRAARGSAEWSRVREAVLHPLVLRWLPQCSSLEGDAEHNWRWCGNQGGLMVENPSGQARKIELRGLLSAADGSACSIAIDASGPTKTFTLNGAPLPFRQSLDVPSGTSIFPLRSDCRLLVAPADPRPLAFRTDNFGVEVQNTPPPLELAWKDGCYALEAGEGKTFHWCSSSGELAVRNPGPAREASIRMRLASTPTTAAPLSITGPGFTESVIVNPAGVVFSKSFLVPSGETTIHFSSQATPVTMGSDPRKLVFRVEDLRYANPVLAPHLIQAN